MLLPRESASLIAKLAKDVKISTRGIEKISDVIQAGFKHEKYDIKQWKVHELHPKTVDQSAIDWIFFVDTLNFSFWSEKEKPYYVSFNNQKYSGYWALCAAVNKALQEGIPITSANYFATVSLKALQHIFHSETGTEIPLIKERQKILNETGKCLIQKFDGSFLNVLSSCKNSAESLLKLVTENFPSYRDEAEINGYKVSLYKRAQILIADIWACCEGKGYGQFDDINFITMFADYRVPQVLIFFGALEYSKDLLKRLENDSLLQNGERLEVEIRGCTIQAVEKKDIGFVIRGLKSTNGNKCQFSVKNPTQGSSLLICECLGERLKNDRQLPSLSINPILIDYYLWDYRRSHADEMMHIPFHKTRCTYY